MAALSLAQDQQKKQAAAKQGQVDAANSSLIGDIGGMAPPAAVGGPQETPGAGLGPLVGAIDKIGGASAPSASAPTGDIMDEDEVYGPLGGGPSGNALRGR